MHTAISLALLIRSASQPSKSVAGIPRKDWAPKRNAASVWLMPFHTMIGT